MCRAYFRIVGMVKREGFTMPRWLDTDGIEAMSICYPNQDRQRDEAVAVIKASQEILDHLSARIGVRLLSTLVQLRDEDPDGTRACEIRKLLHVYTGDDTVDWRNVCVGDWRIGE